MKKPDPIYLIVSRLKRMPLHERIAQLRKMVEAERPRSVRRNELQSLLSGAVTKQVRTELRKIRKERAA